MIKPLLAVSRMPPTPTEMTNDCQRNLEPLHCPYRPWTVTRWIRLMNDQPSDPFALPGMSASCTLKNHKHELLPHKNELLVSIKNWNMFPTLSKCSVYSTELHCIALLCFAYNDRGMNEQNDRRSQVEHYCWQLVAAGQTALTAHTLLTLLTLLTHCSLHTAHWVLTAQTANLRQPIV